MAGTFDINFYDNSAEFINRLEKFDPDVSKALKKEIRQASGDIVKASRSIWDSYGLPLHNWGYGWNTSTGRDLVFHGSAAKGGVKARQYRARKAGVTVAYGYQVVQTNAAAAIFELAGSDNDESKDTRGGSNTFNQNLLNKYPNAPFPRVLYPSYYAGIGPARKRIEAAVQEAARKVGQ